MLRRKNTDSKALHSVQVFSRMAEMKFKPQNCTQSEKIKSNNLEQINSAGSSQRDAFSESRISSMVNVGKRLKYLFALSPSNYLVGNENQVDSIGISGQTFGYIDTEYYWSLNISGPILKVTVDSKKNLIALVSEGSISCFKYNPKKAWLKPEEFKQIQIDSEVRFVQFAKEAVLAVLYCDYFEVFLLEENGEISKKCRKSYKVDQGLSLFAVPQALDNALNVFFCSDSEEEHTFTLWNMKVLFELIEVKVVAPVRIYNINKGLKGQIRLQNYSKDTFLINIGCELFAARRDFIIDSISINIQTESSVLRYISNDRLLYINHDRVEIYRIKIDTAVKPNRIKASPLDSLEVAGMPEHGELLDVLTFGRDKFGVFFQNRPSFNRYAKGEVVYWFNLTDSISREEKVRQIFNYGPQISELPAEVIEGKCDMAHKIGLSEREVYLEIWSRTRKSSPQDYQFVLATQDFKTIHNQIELKLKKESMSFRELLKIYESCLGMLRQRAFSDRAGEEVLQEYLTCHLLVRKLKLFKEIELHQREKNPGTSRLLLDHTQSGDRRFLINIQQFYEYKNFDLKGFLIEQITAFCLDRKDTVTQMRMVLRSFKFVFRVIYRELLTDVIRAAKSSLLSLLQAMPELLPHANPYVEDDEEATMFDGIWKPIPEQEWAENLYSEGIRTVDNAEKVKELLRSVWYKRYWLTSHDLVDKSRVEIEALHARNGSAEIFYFFISEVFERVQNRRNLEVIVEFVENFYERMPEHIKCKVFLYHDLFRYYCQHTQTTRRRAMGFDEFLDMQGHDLFRYFFDLEKVRKNSILKEIKPIYEGAKGECRGIDIFNQGLVEYFDSGLSEISDLKYLLNRMNNEKSEFHEANVSTYEVLVQAMQNKLRIGSEKDIPIEEVLIYIENIPLSKDHYVMAELQTVQRINEESSRFREMRLDMSIREIIENCEEVIARVVEHEFKRHGIRSIHSLEELSAVTYRVLAEVQTVKEKIYGEDMNNLPLFIYISQLLESEDQVYLAGQLLKDEYLNRYFTINEMITENLVLYMYKKRFSQSSSFVSHEQYIRKLLSLLPESSSTRVFIENELEFALLLSTPQEAIEFPISEASVFPRVTELFEIVRFIPAEYITEIDVDRVYSSMRRMQELEMKDSQGDSEEEEYFDEELVTLHQVYEVFIARLIELRMVQQVIPYIRRVTALPYKKEDYNTLYLMLLLLEIAGELNDECKAGIFGMVSYAFEDQERIISLLDFYMTSKLTPLEKGAQVTQILAKEKQKSYNFNEDNPVFTDGFKELARDGAMRERCKALVDATWLHLRSAREEFALDPVYEVVFIVLCNEPYLLAKLLYLEHPRLSFKHLRSFLSYVSQEELFHEVRLLELARRCFYLALNALAEHRELNYSLFTFEGISLQQSVYLKDYHDLDDEQLLPFHKSVKACENKIKSLKAKPRSSRRSDPKDKSSDSESIKIHIVRPENLSESAPSEYPFEDSDDDCNDEKEPRKSHDIRRRDRKSKIEFDVKSERNKFLHRDQKKLGTYMKEKKSTENLNSQSQELPSPMTMKSRQSYAPQITVRQEARVKRAMTLSYDPLQEEKRESPPTGIVDSLLKPNSGKLMFGSAKLPKKKGSHDGQGGSAQKQGSSKQRKKSHEVVAKNISVIAEEQLSTIKEKQKASYLVFDESIHERDENMFLFLEALFESYDAEKKTFNFEKLQKRREEIEDEEFRVEIRELMKAVYNYIDEEGSTRLNLIFKLNKDFMKLSGVKPGVQAVYSQMQMLLERYNLPLPIERVLPVDGLFVEGPLKELFALSRPLILEACNEDNINKLSKVVSLAFRNNTFEQEIAYEYLAEHLNRLESEENIQEVEINLYMDNVRQHLLSKLSTRFLKEKAETNFGEIHEGAVKRRFLELVVSLVRSKGDLKSTKQIEKLIAQ